MSGCGVQKDHFRQVVCFLNLILWTLGFSAKLCWFHVSRIALWDVVVCCIFPFLVKVICDLVIPNRKINMLCIKHSLVRKRGGDWSKLGHPAQNCRFLFLSTFCWQEMTLLRRVTGVFFASKSNAILFRRVLQLCLSARRESNERGKGTPAKWASVEQWDAVRLHISKKLSCPVSRHCAHVACSDRVIINKRTRNYEHTT